MKKFRLFPLILIVCLIFAVSAPSASAVDAPSINAKAALVVDLESGKIIYELNRDDERAPASLTKVMTALLALEAIDSGEISLDDMVTAQDDCRTGMDESSSSAGILPGVQLSMKDLMYCALVMSANEACNIIASHISGSIDAFVAEMNAKAAELGCEHTHFANPNGLPAEGHYSSAYDMYLITKEAMTHPLFMEICNTTSYQCSSSAVNNGYPITNSNALINASSIYGSGYLYEGASGVKTGYTSAAGNCLISTATRGTVSVMAIVMGCSGAQNGSSEGYENFSDSITLYDWTFDNFGYRTILSAAEEITTVEVALAADGGTVILRPAQDLTLLMPNDITDDQITRSWTIYEDQLTAPIAAGTALGELSLSVDGVVYGTVKLVNSSDIQLSRSEYIKMRIQEIFSNGWVIAIVCVVAFIIIAYIALVLRYRALRQKHLKQVRAAEQRRRREREQAAQSAPSIVREDESDDDFDFTGLSDKDFDELFK